MLTSRLKAGLDPRSLAALMTAVIVVALATTAYTASPADAYSAQCGGPRCTLYLNASESRAFAYSSWTPRTGWAQMDRAISIGAPPLRWIARRWIDHGYRCLAYRVSLVPWESQGMTGYRC